MKKIKFEKRNFMKPIRKCKGFNWYINEKWIQQKLSKKYHCKLGDRPLIKTESMSSYEELGAIFYALEGSPPKGYAVYDVKRFFLIIIDMEGKCTRLQNYKIMEED